MIHPDDPAWDVVMRAVSEMSPLSPHKGPDHDAGGGCGHCGSIDDIHLLEGNFACLRCHSVCSRFLDHGAEWRFHSAGDAQRGADPTRCCPPSSDLLPSLGSIIGRGSCRSTPSGNTSLASGGTGGLRMVQKYQIWNSMTYRERTLCGVFDTLAVNAAQHGIAPCILEEAKALYKRLADAKISRGENRAALIASSLYLSCKSNKVPRSIKEIAAMFDIRVSAMTKGCRIFQQAVQLELDSSAPSDFVGRFCSRLGVDGKTIEFTRRVVARADELGILSEATPPSLVSGAIMLANIELKLGSSKKDLADACMVSPATVVKCHKRLEEVRGHLLGPLKTV